MAIVRQEGIGALTMRRIATEVGVGTMSLYRYISDRDDLIDEMLKLAFRKLRIPSLADPEDELIAIFKAIYSLFRAEAWVVIVMVDYAGGNKHVLGLYERIVVALKTLGLADEDAFHTLHTLMHYTYGEALIMEAWDRRMLGQHGNSWFEDHEKFPTISRMIEWDVAAGEPSEEPYITNIRRLLVWARNSQNATGCACIE